MTDNQLWKFTKAGDRIAFGVIYDRYADQMYNAAYTILRDKEACEDIIHELFVHIWIHKEKLEVNTLSGYLLISVRNRVLSSLRKKTESVDISSIQDLPKNMGTSDSRLNLNDIQRILQKNVATLPPKCQEIFVLSREERLPNKAIAAKLNITVKTVENQISIALKRLRTSLEDFLN